MSKEERIDEDELLLVSQASARLHIAESTFYRYVREGKIPVIRGVGRTKVRRSVVEQILREGIDHGPTK